MKKLIILALAVFTLNALAEIEITSFSLINRDINAQDRAAEVCGKVKDVTLPALIKLRLDPDTNAEGTYYTWAGATGKWCQVAVTYAGRVEASIEGTTSIKTTSIDNSN